MTLFILIACVGCLVLLITWAKINPFLAFLGVSILSGLWLGMPLENISKAVTKGIGDTLGSLAIVIVLGAMLGKLVAESGAAQRIAGVMQQVFGTRYLVWAMTFTGFAVGIPLYYNVGFVLLVPIIFSVAYRYNLPLVYIGLPMLASLSVMHGFLPPHPSPIALVMQFDADMATTFGYGMIIAIPAIVVAGPLFAQSLKRMPSATSVVDLCPDKHEDDLPGVLNSFASSLLPVIVIGVTTLLEKFWITSGPAQRMLSFLAEPNVAMSLTLVISTCTLGLYTGKKLSHIMAIYTDAVKDIAMILLIIGSAGILKQIFIDSGVSNDLATGLKSWPLPPLLLAWLVTAGLRLALGSATIAGLTAAGIISPLVQQTGIDPNLMVLAIGAGSLFCSHVNDTAFWLFKEYFGLTIQDTLRSWTLMESLVSVLGLLGVLCIDYLL
ncbi:gluconate:H+ symporter [Dawidia soli]|uniref:GntP family permease n=1 Tax=Dawidia soli TaxID=2782352 RepID=A0AAP2DBZ6_9BACT|nr:gluconate:H+ symporter [Dawidia soli]MBT1689174.1 GntP family permease [Dawidia soli]